ncbi:MAG: HEAT repeat domain-containing protein, partial [Myxococcota bacterium]|nr:HEAT repeat domain-containing protein [Myxococcota bacterium]
MPSVRDTERERFAFFFVLSALLGLAQTLGLAGSEALFLERVGPEALAGVFVAAPVISVLGCLAYAAVVGEQRNDDLLAAMLVLAGVALVAGAGLAVWGAPFVFHALFCAAYLTQAVLINLHFWTFAADFFDTLQSKRLYPYLVVGASGGGVAGGAIAALAGVLFPAEALIALWAVALLSGALLVIRVRPDLRRWRAIGGEERDESSTSGLRGALRFLSRSRLAMWLVISIVGMISSLFLLQYVYLGIFSESFDSAETLAVFLGSYLAISNGVEILTATVVTPWLLQRFGVPTANLVHPVLTVAVFPVVAANPALLPAVLARVVRELLENAMAAPIRQLAYNALPFRFRGRVRALLEGVVLFAAMALAGGVLLLIAEEASLAALCGLGMATGVAYLAASFAVRRAYLSSLVDELRHGRLDLHEMDAGLGTAGMANLAEQWQRILEEEGPAPAHSVLRFARDLAENGFGEVVVHASHHRHARVREACIDALLDFDPAALEPHLERLLEDADSQVRLATLRALVEFPTRSDRIDLRLEASLEDADPEIRAAAAFAAGPPGVDTLRGLLDADDPAQVVPALEVLPAELTELALPALDHEAAGVRAAAIYCLAREAFDAPLPTARLLDAMRDRDAEVRAAAARALVYASPETTTADAIASSTARADDRALDEEQAITEVLVEALDDDARSVRVAAGEALAARGPSGVEAALAQVRHPRLWTAHAALHAATCASDFDVVTPLLRAYRDCVRDAWRFAASRELAPDEPNFVSRFTRIALANAH